MRTLTLWILLGALPAMARPVPSLDLTSRQMTVSGLTWTQGHPWSGSSLGKRIGKPSRELTLANRLSLYDWWGLAFYQAPQQDTISEVQLYFRPDQLNVSPKSGFSGQFTLEGHPLRASSPVNPQQIRTILRTAWKEDHSYEPGCLVFRSPVFQIYLHFDETESHLVRLAVDAALPPR